jgi:hypothetical protein
MVIVEPSLLAKTIFPARRVAVQVSYHAVRIINWAQAYAMFYKGTIGIQINRRGARPPGV